VISGGREREEAGEDDPSWEKARGEKGSWRLEEDGGVLCRA